MLESLLFPDERLELAERKVVAQCMGREGHDFPPYEVFEPVRNSLRELSDLFGALPSPDVARKRGYGDLVGAWPDHDLAERHYLGSLSKSERREYRELLDPLRGPTISMKPPGADYKVETSARGCWSEARRRVYGTLRNSLRLGFYFSALRGRGEEVIGDSHVRAALNAYSRCMEVKGYSVQSPKESIQIARRLFGERNVDGRPTVQEKVMAIDDAMCQQNTGYVQRLEEALLRRTSGWIQAHEGQIVDLANVQRESLQRAITILDTGRVETSGNDN